MPMKRYLKPSLAEETTHTHIRVVCYSAKSLTVGQIRKPNQVFLEKPGFPWQIPPFLVEGRQIIP